MQQVERIYKLTVDGSAAVRQLDQIAKSSAGVESKMAGLGKAFKNVAAGIAAGASFGAFASSIRSTVDAFDEMAKASQKVGVATEELSKLKYAADLSGVSFEGLQNGLKQFNKNIANVEEGTNDAARALRSLGISAESGTTEALEKVADEFAKMEDGPKKTAVAMQLFGKAGADLIPLLNGGSEAIRQMGDEAEQLGVVMGGAAAKSAEAFNDNLTRLSKAAEGARNQVVTGLLPAMGGIAQSFVDGVKAGGGFADFGRGLGEVLVFLTKTFYLGQAAVNAFATSVAGVAAAMTLALEGNFSGAWSAIKSGFADAGEAALAAGDKMNKLDAEVAKATENLGKTAATAPKTGSALENLAKSTEKSSKAAKENADAQREMADAIKRQYDNTIAWIESGEQVAKIEAEQAKALQAKIDTYDKVGSAARAYAEAQREIDDLFFSGKVSVEEYDRMLAQLADTQGRAADSAKKLKEESDGTEDVLSALQTAAFDLFSNGFKNGEEVLKKFAQQLANIAFQIIVVEPLIKSLRASLSGIGGGGGILGSIFGIPNAHGNVYATAGLSPYINTVVDRPTIFPFAQGGRFGLMGEAGAEAIVPLRRNSQGDLGVSAAPVTVNIQNNAPVDVGVSESRGASGDRQIDILIEQKVNRAIGAGRFDTALRGAFGVTRRGN